ncbi:hypothetical protein P154DRAFT_428186, partial [Amniculicola lignicola CBS 123094]
IDYNNSNSPKDYIIINLCLGIIKVKEFFIKLKDVLAYYITISLYPIYKNYLEA